MVLRHVTRILVVTCSLFLLASNATAQHGRRWGDSRESRRIEVRVGTDEWYRGDYGGAQSAAELAPGCIGWVPSEPNFVLVLDSERWVRLSVEARDDDDTMMLLGRRSGPICNNDASRYTRDPEIVTHLEPGVYRLFVGSVEEGREGRFDLHVVDLAQGELPELADDERLSLIGVSGGPVDAGEYGGGCIGAIPASPSHTVLLAKPRFLAISAASSSDLTLVVVADDRVRCNDDGPRTLNPQLIDWFPEGPLRIYVGSHNDAVRAYYTLTIEPSEPVTSFGRSATPEATP